MSDDIEMYDDLWTTPVSDMCKELRRVARWTLNPPPSTLLSSAANRLQHLEAIVRDLAAGSKPIDSQDFACVLCDADLFGRGEFGRDPAVHRESCPWRRAKELLGDE